MPLAAFLPDGRGSGERHCGKLEACLRQRTAVHQHGKDLTGVKSIIGTGGPVIFSQNPKEILQGALYRENNPFALKPRKPVFYLDTEYLLMPWGCWRNPSRRLP